jgi:alanine racemase
MLKIFNVRRNGLLTEYGRVKAFVDLNAIAANTREVKRYVGDRRLCAVVKADGYGHGAVETARVALDNGASSLAVAICEEGVALRESGIDAPILNLGFTPSALFDEVARFSLAQTVFHVKMARELSAAAKKRGVNVKIHIKIDTGMSRLGFMPDLSAASEITDIMALDNIVVEGIYTHLATSDEAGSGFVYEQLERFQYFLSLLGERNISIPCVHASNSGAIVNYPDIPFAAVRAGITLYGLPPANFLDLKGLNLIPAMTLKSRISYIKNIGANVSVGYGRSFFTKRPSKIATVPIGYADGYPRNLSNKANTIVRGAFAPIAGNICMDQLMLDVTDIKDADESDEVILIGSQNGLTVSACTLADLIGTINYEIVCNIGKRVPRAYV